MVVFGAAVAVVIALIPLEPEPSTQELRFTPADGFGADETPSLGDEP